MGTKKQIDQVFEKLYRISHQFTPKITINEEGYISKISDGIIEVKDLSSVAYFELLKLPHNLFALVLNITKESVQAVVLGDYTTLNVKDIVTCTDQSISIPVGYELLGKVIDPLSKLIDEKKEIKTKEYYHIEREAVKMTERDFVKEPLYTGIKIIDAMIPIGKGQRELIISDSSLGKTSIAVNTIINQKDKNVYCIYVAIGQKKAQISRVINDLKKSNALSYTIIIAAPADAAPGLKFIAPYSGSAIAEFFADQGKDVLIIYDDLTKHADTYRSISLLLEIPPGREAYPGDIFFIHAKLLERAGKRSDRHKGGSITALPIVETQAGRISDYIPTNLISITDGQIYLDRELFNRGFLPAIDIGRSVSRIGAKAQVQALKKMAIKLKLDYSQFLEVEIFTKFGAKVEKETQELIDKGQALRVALKQDRLEHISMPIQVAIFFLHNEGYLKTIPLEHIELFIDKFAIYLQTHYQDILQAVATANDIDNYLVSQLKTATETFINEWQS
ncbi:MAG: F0F1 ATP synthase subunit alpha [Sulfurospirillaceae bacterium]|nr:F0F1 ATP synthase subunit alpha [Sulfurospirillaceae bacterium]